MELIDFSGKLNEHEEYLKILQRLESKTRYIEIVIPDGKDKNNLVQTFASDVILSKKVSEWWGTKTSSINNLYRIKASDALFRYLAEFETFCRYYEYGTNVRSANTGLMPKRLISVWMI